MTVLDDLWEIPPDDVLPPLDRSDATPASNWQAEWMRDGLVILRGFLPDDLIDAYAAVYPAEGTAMPDGSQAPGEWGSPTPYLGVPELQDLACFRPLTEVLEHLIGEPMGLHLNLTSWRSTERDWHQDDYLNPADVFGHYAAVWMALDDIHPDSGPFEFIRGSHRWPLIRRDKVLQALGEDGADGSWPWRTEALLRPLVEERAAQEGLVVEAFDAKRGDVLIWHARLMHRGSRPRTPGLERRALISHYSGTGHRPDMTARRVRPDGSTIFVLDGSA